MVFVSDPSILFKKSQVLWAFFPATTTDSPLSSFMFISPNCGYCQLKKLFPEKRPVCVCDHAHTHVGKRKRQTGGKTQTEKESRGCVSECVLVCLRICFQKAQPLASQDHLVKNVISASLLFICMRQLTDLRADLTQGWHLHL